MEISPLFQFHKGTIKTNATEQDTIKQTHFNSIKVRLKPVYTFHSTSKRANFNSIKVRLKRVEIVDESAVSHFNSIKVRLKPKIV